MKYPIGIQDFESIRKGGYVYVDKTALVYSLTHEGKVYFLGRPRRFGKSLLISTLECYYQGRRDLFGGLAIDGLETEWLSYPVFHIDFGQGNYEHPDALEQILGMYLSDWEAMYHVDNRSLGDNFGLRLGRLLEAAHRQSGLPAVVLVDEYDKPLLDVMDTAIWVERSGERISLEQYNRETLRGLYTTFKAADRHLQFVMLTGVTKFSQVSMFSGFNQPRDISMSARYDTICGITGDEMLAYFQEPIAEMAGYYRCTPAEMVDRLRRQYDGYHFSDMLRGVYNPFSLLNAFCNLRMQDYWFRTGTPTYLVRLLDHFGENMDELTGRYYLQEQFVDYKADVERPLPMIYQSGYLTIKDFDYETNTFKLDFPNDEVKRGFLAVLANSYLKPKNMADNWVITAASDLKRGELERFHTGLSAFLASIPYTMRRKEDEHERERYFHYTFYLLLRLLSTFLIYTEKVQSQGRVDCVIETQHYIYIFEFKLDGTADEALAQIEAKGYAREYAGDTRHTYRIGCSFSSETGTICDWKVAEGE